ncbi:DGQHR domain-containing protein [Peijinzhouia sedimentorum]
MEKIVEDKIIGFPIIQNQQDFVIAKFNIKQIFSFTKYTTRILNSFDEDGEPIYNNEIQREIEKARVEKIADFLIEDPEATFPTNLVLHIPVEAIETQHEFIKEHISFVEIKLKQKVFDELKKNKVFITIIDGQHRIRGIEIALGRIKSEIDALTKTLRTGKNSDSDFLERKLTDRVQRLKDLENIELVVSFFIDKTIEYQAMIFSTINRTQKRVSQSLVYDLFGLNTDDSPHKTAIQVIISLNGHKNSPFYRRIKFYGGDYSSENSPPLSQATMAKSIVNLISENLRESERDRYRSRKELNKKTEGSSKFLPFRKYYANDKDYIISDIMFFYFSSVKKTFKGKNEESLWIISESGKPENILQTTVGYDSLLKILVDILREKNIETPSISYFDFYLTKCKNLKLYNTVRYPFNNKGKRILYLDLSLSIWPFNPNDVKDVRLRELELLTTN